MTPQKIGRYEVKSELGRGGMATVYQAFDPRFKREVAIKVLPREFLHDPRFLARFEREAQTIAALEYPAIVPVHDFGEDVESGQPYIVMRLMTGGSLADRLENGPLPLPEAARIFSQLAPALDKAHAKGIIHRDLKPGNILFDTDNNAYISDFGIAKLAEATASFTGSGVIGTPAYMSPEQVRGDHGIDGRSDIYALGVILFQVLTGVQPYQADTPMGMAVKHLTEPTPRILAVRPDLPSSCEPLIQKAMAKEREARFSTAQELVESLLGVAKGGGIQPSPTLKATGLPETLLARPISPPERRRPWWLFGLVGLVLLSGGVALWLGLRPQAPVAEALVVTASHTPTRTPSVTPSPTVPTQTPTPSETPTITLPTLGPTRTATPPPAWVRDFAQPILSAIAGQPPTFEDDFSDKSGGWKLADWVANLGYRLIFADGEITVSSGPASFNKWFYRDMWYPDFVIELDYRFLPGAHTDDRLSFGYRHPGGGQDAPGNGYDFHYNGDVEAYVQGASSNHDSRTRLPGAAHAGKNVNHVLLIAKGQEFALYINDRPVFYKMGDFVYPNGGIKIEMNDAVAIDNFKLWDISDFSP